jgi:peptidoglycan hydrolase CwlO-like protein
VDTQERNARNYLRSGSVFIGEVIMQKKIFWFLLLGWFFFHSCKTYPAESKNQTSGEEVLRLVENVEKMVDSLLITLDELYKELDDLQARVEQLEREASANSR